MRKPKAKGTGDASKSSNKTDIQRRTRCLAAIRDHFRMGDDFVSPYTDGNGVMWDFGRPDGFVTVKIFNDPRYDNIKSYSQHGWSHHAMFIFDLEELGPVYEYTCGGCQKQHLSVPRFINLGAAKLSALIYFGGKLWWSTFNDDWEPVPLWRDRTRTAKEVTAKNN